MPDPSKYEDLTRMAPDRLDRILSGYRGLQCWEQNIFGGPMLGGVVLETFFNGSTLAVYVQVNHESPNSIYRDGHHYRFALEKPGTYRILRDNRDRLKIVAEAGTCLWLTKVEPDAGSPLSPEA